MKIIGNFLGVLSALFLISGCSCDRSDDSKVVVQEAPKAKSKIISPEQNTFRIGEEIPFSIALVDTTTIIDSVNFYLDEELQGTIRSQPFKFFINSQDTRVGSHLLRAMIYYKDGSRDITRTTISLLSDIEPARYSYRVIRKYPHDPQAFTQGLVYDGQLLYEGTGQKGESSLRKVELQTGNVLQNHYLASNLFGEGIALYENKIIQLTWKSRVGFVYDKDTFDELQQFTYTTEGWGITTMENSLIMSDGSATLYQLDPQSFAITDKFEVYNQFGPIVDLNELEYIKGVIFANVFQTEEIAMIDPGTGKLIGIADMSGLVNFNDRTDRVDVLNGIAYVQATDHLLVTGKWWPNIYEVELIELQPAVALTTPLEEGS